MSFAGLLASVAGPIAKRVLVALGVGIISAAGVTATVTMLLGAARDKFGVGVGAAPALAVQLIDYFNLGAPLALIAGGVTARLALTVVMRLGVVS